LYAEFRDKVPALSARTAVLIFGLALIVRLVAVFIIYNLEGETAFLAPDSESFLTKALTFPGLAGLFGFDPSYAPDRGVMPIPAWLMGVSAKLMADAPVLGYILLQSLIDSLTCVAIACLAGRVLPSWGWLAGVLAAFNPTQIAVSLLYLTDTGFLFFATLLLFAGLRYIRHPGWGLAMVLGVLLGLAGLSRAAILPVAPVFLTLVFLLCRNTSLSKRFAEMSVIVSMFCLVLSPAVIRNAVQYDSYVVTSQGGDHLLFWVVPLVRNFDTGIPLEETKAEALRLLDERKELAFGGEKDLTGFQSQIIAEQLGWEMLWRDGLIPVLKAWSAGAALNILAPASTDFPVLRDISHSSFYETTGDNFLGKVFNFLTLEDNRSYVLVMGLSFLGVAGFVLLAGVGVVVAFHRLPAETVILCVWVCCILALNGPIASPKYRLPIEPVWMVLAAAGLVWLNSINPFTRARSRFRQG